MKQFFTLKTLALAATMLLSSQAIMAGDGTKENPYTPGELNAQKEALKEKASTLLPFESNVVWVRAELKGLGEDGTLTDNADTEELNQETGKTVTVHHLAGLFGDDKDNFVAYSWQILGQVAMEDFTNTKDLLIALTYQEHSHTYANSENPWQGQDYEPDEFHFSLVEVYGALSLEIKNGYRGFHIPCCYIVPEGVCLTTVYAGYTAAKGAYMSYRYYDGADAQAHVTSKNIAAILMAKNGTYDFVLTTELYEQAMGNTNTLNPGTQAGENKGTKKNRTRMRFVSSDTKTGFERNSDENSTVTLASKDEIYLEVSSLANNFSGNWTWETEAKNWITWNGGSYEDQHANYANFDFTTGDLRYIGESASDTKGWIYNETYSSYFISLQAVTGTSPCRIYADNNRGNCFVFYKDGMLIVRAPKGNAVTKVEFTVAGNSNLNKVVPSSGAIEGLVWTGNAEAVRFVQGATTYLANVAVTTAEKDESTAVLPALEYVSCANIADFNALEDGALARVQISDAQVIGKSADGVTTAWIQDATGGASLQYTSINDKLEEGKRIFGSFIVKKSGNQMREAEDGANSEALPQDLDKDLYVVEGTLAEVNVPENLNRLVRIKGASFVATSKSAGNLTQGDATIGVDNGIANSINRLHKIDEEWTKDETTMENVNILAILFPKNATSNLLLPISMVEEEYTGINQISTASVKDLNIFDLNGRRVNKPVRGLYIIDGKKVVGK